MDSPKDKKKTVLVGLSGGIDSLIAAWLLKRQGHHVIGLGILFAPDQSDQQLGLAASKTKISQEDEEEKEQIEVVPFQGVYLIEDVEAIKTACDKVGIPFYAVNARKRYEMEITDLIVSAKLAGYHFGPELFAINTIVEVLRSKMEPLAADKIATGHYARIIQNKITGNYNIYTAKNAQDDQSFQLANINQDTLKYLELPLAGMRRQEVEKIAASLGLAATQPTHTPKMTMSSRQLSVFVKQHSAPSLRQGGTILHHMTDAIIGEHNGIHHFYLGHPIDLQDIKTRDANLSDKDLVPVHIHDKTAKVTVISKADHTPIDKVILSRCGFDKKIDFSRPLNAWLAINNNKQKFPTTIYFLNNKKIFCDLKSKMSDFVFPGDFGILYDAKDGNAKIIAGGLVSKAGYLNQQGKMCSLPVRQDQEDDDEEAKKVVDIHAFKF